MCIALFHKISVFCFETKIFMTVTSDVLLARSMVVDPDEICVNYFEYRYQYDRNAHFCVNKTIAPCEYDGPIVGIDTSNPDKPYWYLFGIFVTGPENCVQYPKLNAQIFPELNWILTVVRDQNEF